MSEGASEVQNEIQESGSLETSVITNHAREQYGITHTENVTPHSLPELEVLAAEETPEEKTPRKFGRYIIVTTAGASVLLGAAGFMIGKSLVATDSHPNGAPDPDGKILQTVGPVTPVASPIPTQEAPASPEPTPSQALNQEINTPNPTEIPASLSPEVMANKAFEEIYVDWRRSGMTSDLAERQAQSGLSPEIFAASVANIQAAARVNALYVDGWENIDDLSVYAGQLQTLNAQDVLLETATSKESNPFKWTTQDEKLTIENSGTEQVRFHVIFNDSNNSNANTATTIDPSVATEPVRTRINVIMVKVGDSMKISSIRKFNF